MSSYHKTKHSLQPETKVSIPESLEISLGEIACDVKDGLLSLSVAVGMRVLKVMMENEVEQIAGLRGKHNPCRRAFRHGTEQGSVTLGGRRVGVERPRVRTRQNKEVRIETYETFQDESVMTEAALQTMIHGLSSRDYRYALEPVGQIDSRSTSKSTVSRKFVAATSAALKQLLERRLDRITLVALLLDGIEIAEHTVVVALGIDSAGSKQVLGVWEGATENATVCKALLSDLVGRGLNTDQGVLVVTDGSKALRAAVREVLGKKAEIQRCQVHKKRNVVEHLPESSRGWVGRKMEQIWIEPDYGRAVAGMKSLACKLEQDYPGAAASLREGLEETLTVNRLKIPGLLRVSLRSTNAIETAFDKVRQHSRNVKRWQSGEQVLRWVSAGLLEAEEGFRKVKGYRQIPVLIAALAQKANPGTSSMVKTAGN